MRRWVDPVALPRVPDNVGSAEKVMMKQDQQDLVIRDESRVRRPVDVLRADMMNISSTTVTRLEVIDETSRAYTRHDCQISIALDDEGKTLKIFVEQRIPPEMGA